MKSMFLALAATLLSLTLSAQNWSENYADAQALAKEEGKNIVLVFSGSDWCGPCIRLEREIWTAEGFSEMAAEDFVFYKADFPRRKVNKLSEELSAQNSELAEKYNLRGAFPLVVILTPEGEVLGKTGYKKLTPPEYLAVLKGFAK
jgi:thioredoxin-related protein